MEAEGYHVHKGLPLVSTQSQKHSVHTFPPYFPKIHSNNILQSADKSYEFCMHFSSLPCMIHAPSISSS